MADTLTTEPLPPLKPQERHARLEVDAFCIECGYNLHSQEVVRDERLGIFVCRCPECGRFHPAGVGVTATRTWLNRLATILLFFWILIILFGLFWIVLGFGAIQQAFVDSFAYRKMIAIADGRDVEWRQSTSPGSPYLAVYKGTTQPAGNWRMIKTLERSKDDRKRTMRDLIPFLVGAAALGFATGVLLVVFFWHWKRRRYVWPMLLPIADAGLVIATFVADDEYDPIRAWAIRMAFGWGMVELTFMGLGILAGRPIARTLLRMFVPPRPRQHFAFLWSVDGKTVPPASPAAM